MMEERIKMPVIIGAKRESDFSNPIGLLGDCHRRIERFLSVLIQVAKQAHGEPLTEEQRSALDAALRYFREAAPKHTADEERSLFPRLRRLNRPDVKAVLARMDSLEQDHQQAQSSHSEIDRLGQLWLANGKLLVDEMARFAALLAELSELYRNHITTEDQELFPVAANALDAAERQAIGHEMAARRGLAEAGHSGNPL
jgi:hemerythrin-like domain-containing protein